MNEWKKLDLANLPSDILVGDYEFEYYDDTFDSGEWCPCGINSSENWCQAIVDAKSGDEVRYRLRQPEPPTHEEIMTKWWKTDKNNCWCKPVQYYEGFYGLANTVYPVTVKNQSKEWFIGRESATLPPESE